MNDQITLALARQCRECGSDIPWDGGPGRPRVLCDGCRPAEWAPIRGRRINQSSGGISAPASRRTDPPTSGLAAERVADTAEKVEARIRASFAAFGWLTDDELCAVTEGLPATIKTARSRMKNRGEIVKTGQKRPSNTGSPMIVWKLA